MSYQVSVFVAKSHSSVSGADAESVQIQLDSIFENPRFIGSVLCKDAGDDLEFVFETLIDEDMDEIYSNRIASGKSLRRCVIARLAAALDRDYNDPVLSGIIDKLRADRAVVTGYLGNVEEMDEADLVYVIKHLVPSTDESMPEYIQRLVLSNRISLTYKRGKWTAFFATRPPRIKRLRYEDAVMALIVDYNFNPENYSN